MTRGWTFSPGCSELVEAGRSLCPGDGGARTRCLKAGCALACSAGGSAAAVAGEGVSSTSAPWPPRQEQSQPGDLGHLCSLDTAESSRGAQGRESPRVLLRALSSAEPQKTSAEGGPLLLPANHWPTKWRYREKHPEQRRASLRDYTLSVTITLCAPIVGFAWHFPGL